MSCLGSPVLCRLVGFGVDEGAKGLHESACAFVYVCVVCVVSHESACACVY